MWKGSGVNLLDYFQSKPAFKNVFYFLKLNEFN